MYVCSFHFGFLYRGKCCSSSVSCLEEKKDARLRRACHVIFFLNNNNNNNKIKTGQRIVIPTHYHSCIISFCYFSNSLSHYILNILVFQTWYICIVLIFPGKVISYSVRFFFSGTKIIFITLITSF